MDIAEILKIGEAIENMTQSDGWKYFDKYMSDRESEYIGQLKKAKNMDEVTRLQAYLEFIDKIRAKVREWINNKNAELVKEAKK